MTEETPEKHECKGTWEGIIPQEDMDWLFNALNEFIENSENKSLGVSALGEFIVHLTDNQVLPGMMRNPFHPGGIIAAALETVFELGRVFEREQPFTYVRVDREKAAAEMRKAGRDHFLKYHPNEELPEVLSDNFKPEEQHPPRIVVLPMQMPQMALPPQTPQPEESDPNFQPGGYI